MRPFVLCVLLLAGAVPFSSAQPHNIIWQTTAGCSGNDNVIDFMIEPDGYLLAGMTGSSCTLLDANKGMTDVFLIKLDKGGNKLWSKRYGGSGGDGMSRIKPVSGGGYILLGNSTSADGDIQAAKGSTDFWVLRLDAAGTVLWSRNFGGSGIDYPYDIVETPDSSFIAVGYTTSADGDVSQLTGGPNDAWIIRIDDEGSLVWEKTYGSSQRDIAYSIVRTTGDNYTVAAVGGAADGDVPLIKGSSDGWIFDIDGAGNISNSKTYGGTKTDDPKMLLRTKDGGYLLAGNTTSADLPRGAKGMDDLWVVKTDAAGNVQWQNTYGGSFEDGIRAVMESKEGGYLLVAASKSNDKDALLLCHGAGDIWVLKLDDTGRIEWTKMYGGSNGEGAGASVYQLEDSTYMIAGTSNSSNGDVLVNNGAADAWMIRLGKAFPAGMHNSAATHKLNVYPTITHDVVHIAYSGNKDLSFKLYNMPGQELPVHLQQQGNEYIVELAYYPAGMYLLQLQYNGKTEVHKIWRE